MKQEYRNPPHENYESIERSSYSTSLIILFSSNWATWKYSSYSIAFTFHEKQSATWTQDSRIYTPTLLMSTSHQLRKMSFSLLHRFHSIRLFDRKQCLRGINTHARRNDRNWDTQGISLNLALSKAKGFYLVPGETLARKPAPLPSPVRQIYVWI